MSLASWKKQFYPTKATRLVLQSAVGIVGSTLRKWLGLQEVHLNEHNVELVYVEESSHIATIHLRDKKSGVLFDVGNAKHNPLCVRYYNIKDMSCSECPLCIARDGDSCTQESDNGEESPWTTFCVSGDPDPMIDNLYRTWYLVFVNGGEGQEN